MYKKARISAKLLPDGMRLLCAVFSLKMSWCQKANMITVPLSRSAGKIQVVQRGVADGACTILLKVITKNLSPGFCTLWDRTRTLSHQCFSFTAICLCHSGTSGSKDNKIKHIKTRCADTGTAATGTRCSTIPAPPPRKNNLRWLKRMATHH